ncbi:cupredoxin domain-containing protein [Alteromonas facilis]|uniref:cupredoxin domain-containing protein n=1 Tax=Alteromonas facilis TaxID=2048004 RepID=UPI000C283401|nr:cupredoxin domain-containing protein [Alteromonas facilis]
MKRRFSRYVSGLMLWCLGVMSAWAETPVFRLELRENTFTPSELVIPANTKVRLVITNMDDTAEEFDSFDLNRERVIFANSSSTIFIGPLPPGRYEYFGEYHPVSARGFVVVEEVQSVN